ncbi:MAG TPA: putative Ig domain-containing protein, partial [Candidatus Saccharimonadales bacterium]|nr:putative Ig domain-containing protein [Candidatus Saccharimonadales bacterium]
VAGANQTATIKVTDAQGLSATSSGLTITVYSQLVITPPSLPLPTGVVNVAYPAETFTASGGSGSGYTFSLASGSLPSPLTVGAGGTIASAVPTASGTFTFAVKVTDSVSNTATTANISLTINPAISVTLSPAQPFSMDQATSQLITATVNNDLNSAGVTWSTLTGNGSLSGSTTSTITYTTPGSIPTTSIATFTATSITDPSKSASFSVSLEPPPTITTSSLPSGTVGGAYTSAVSVSGGVGPYTWSFTTLPAGLSLSSSTTNTVNITGTPTTAGASQTVTIKVTDAKGLFYTLNSTITVLSNSGQISGQISLNNTCGGSVTLPTFTVTINTTPTSQSVQTDSNGNFSFTSIPNGTYMITPSISGAASSVFYPANITGVAVNSGSVSGENFNAVVGYNVSGTVSYSGSQTGQTYVSLQNNNCGGYGAQGTSITQATLGSGGAYTIHSVPPGNYTLNAWMDSTGVTSGTKYPGEQGQPNANDPTGSNSSVSVTTASVTGVGVTLTSPTYSTPTANPTMQVFPSAGGVAIFYNPSTPTTGNKVEDANEYVVEWAVPTGTDGLGNTTCALGGGTGGAQFLTIAGSHTFYGVGAHGATVWILSNTMLGAGTFTSGQSYCFQARSFNTLATTTHPSGWSNYAYSNGSPLPVKIVSNTSALCSTNCTTVSGTVTIPSGVTPVSGAPLYVGLYQQSPSSNGPSALYATEISAPVTGANSYSITIPNGSDYFIFGILDQNNDGQIDAGDVTDTNNNSNASGVTLSGSATTIDDNSLPATNSNVTVQTQYSACGTNCSSYNLNLQVREGNKLPVAVTLYSGPNLLNPVDMGHCSNCGNVQYDFSANLPGGTPNVGDTYNFTVTYSDGSVDQGSAGTINGKVTAFGSTGAVAGANDLPTNLSPSGTSSTSTTPTFTWTFPTNPSNYTYSFYLQQNNCSGNCTIWQIPNQNSNSNGFTYAQTQNSATTGQIVWGTDPTGGGNSPSVSALTTGATYNWSISVQDANNNQAQASVSYVP